MYGHAVCTSVNPLMNPASFVIVFTWENSTWSNLFAIYRSKTVGSWFGQIIHINQSQGLKLVSKMWFYLWNTNFLLEYSVQISVLSLHGIFPWNKLQSRVSFTFQPDVPKHFVNEKQPPKESVIHTVYSEFLSGRCSVDSALSYGSFMKECNLVTICWIQC